MSRLQEHVELKIANLELSPKTGGQVHALDASTIAANARPQIQGGTAKAVMPYQLYPNVKNVSRGDNRGGGLT
jgi:hypothetical protein